MDSYKLALKFFVTDPPAHLGTELVPVFHKWIQTHAVADHLLVDVADYAHVYQGPGTMLIAYEANFGMDSGGGRMGLLYQRKQAIPDAGTFLDRLRVVARATLEAAKRLEDDPALAGRFTFRTDEFTLRIYDRLLAPNTSQTFDAIKGDIEKFVTDLYGKPLVSLRHQPSAGSLFEVIVQAPGFSSLSDLLSRLPAPAASMR